MRSLVITGPTSRNRGIATDDIMLEVERQSGTSVHQSFQSDPASSTCSLSQANHDSGTNTPAQHHQLAKQFFVNHLDPESALLVEALLRGSDAS